MPRRYALPQPYEELDHTADAGVIVRGADPAETLARLVLAMSALLTGGAPVEAGERRTVSVEAADLAAMAIDVLRELLYVFDCERLIARACEVDAFEPNVAAEVTVELGPHDERAHEEGTELKAVTLHEARFEPEGDGWVAQVVFDV